jgi:heme O synthase-like polyprenyltransferase
LEFNHTERVISSYQGLLLFFTIYTTYTGEGGIIYYTVSALLLNQIPLVTWQKDTERKPIKSLHFTVNVIMLQKPHQSFHLVDGSNDLSALDDMIAIAI